MGRLCRSCRGERLSHRVVVRLERRPQAARCHRADRPRSRRLDRLFSLLLKAHRIPPPLYDISTDTVHPPSYVAGLELRQATARLPAEYPANFAAQQRQAYPDIQPVMMNLPPDLAFERALRAARETSGWNIHAVVPQDGRIEVVAKTLWFGFEDDVVIRVMATEGGSRIDIRSTGRIARRDGGANARRVQAYIKKLNAAG